MTQVRPIDANVIPAAGGRAARQCYRRGVLLLIVISMLTLFMMLGVAYLVAATRARTAAKAYAKLTFGADEARIPVAALLDDVLLRVVRGPAPAILASGTSFESLLEDKYGDASTTLFGTANVTTTSNSPILTGTLTLPSGNPRPTDLVGRVLTFVAPGHVATSHRIVRVRRINEINNEPDTTNEPGTKFEITLDKFFRSDGAVPTTGREVPVTINGREFSGDPAVPTDPNTPPDSNEPWDGFDHVRNPFLARVTASPTSIATSVVTKASYLESAPSANLCDNDGDGVPDGEFFSWDLPSFTDAAGNAVTVDASVLVVDLDGRFNVNAHASLAPTLYPDDHGGWTTTTGINDSPNRNRFNDTPMGSGYGPADIQFNAGTGKMASGTSGSRKMFDGPTSRANGENQRLSIVVGDNGTRQTGKRPANSRFGQNAETPRLGQVDGKYGESPSSDADIGISDLEIGNVSNVFPRPGEPYTDDLPSKLNDRRALPDQPNRGLPAIWWNANDSFNWHAHSTEVSPRGVFNSPADLHGRMKTLTLAPTGQSIVPRLVFAKPEWDGSSGSLAAETKDDPYELLLDTRRGVGGWNRDPTSSNNLRHNPFTLAELEPVLRPYDGDTSRQPQRLATMLGTDSEAGRLKFTTDSWDTTTITGSAALRIYGKPGSATGWLQTIDSNNPTALSGTSPGTGLLSGELARGEKFDLNRAFDPSALGNAGYQPIKPYFEQRQAYFKDLYTLLVALESGTGAIDQDDADKMAQWAANVVKFRDADSRVIPFEYEQDIKQNGWQLNNDVGATGDSGTRRVVWPAVRPEIVIREVVAWNNSTADPVDPGKSGMVISLHRPWNAKAYASGTANVIDAEPCDYALDTLADGQTGRPTNRIDLGKKADASVLGENLTQYNNVTSTHYPIWRLRITDGATTRYVRFDTNDPGADEIAIPGITNHATKPKMGPDSTLTLYSGKQIAVGTAPTVTTAAIDVDTHGGETLEVPTLDTVAAAIMSGTAFLERLSDPSVTLTVTGTAPGLGADGNNSLTGKDIWEAKAMVLGTAEETQVPVRYVVVDRMPFTVSQTTMAPPCEIAVSRRRTNGDNAFWEIVPNHPPAAVLSVPDTPPPSVPGALTGGDTAWFVWPNRPFTSAAELLLVPQGNCETMLESYQKPDPARWETPLSDAVRGLFFDCVHVPTRFSGIHLTTTDSKSADTGIYPVTTPVNQFSSYREPGRVNLNTITSEEVWNAVVAGPLATPVVSGTTAGLGMASSSNEVVKTTLEALSLQVSGTAVRPDPDPGPPAPSEGSTPIDGVNENPLHAIYTATRLANTVTTRSNVFAVWITLREQVAGDPDSVRYHRGFYIVDRSIPVGFEAGKDHNVWDCVRLRRIIE